MTDDFRTEHDSMGEVRVPAEALWRAQTQRAVENFPISGTPLEPRLVRALALVKQAAARTNGRLGVVTPEQAVEYARATGIGIYHAVGSCAMGPKDEDVVDARLRVRGVRGLRVVDASVFPAIPAGNTAAPTMALAWRAADLVGAEA